MYPPNLLCLIIFFYTTTTLMPVSATEFVSNSFKSTDISLYGNDTVDSTLLPFSLLRTAFSSPLVVPFTLTKYLQSNLTVPPCFPLPPPSFSQLPQLNMFLLVMHGFAFLFSPSRGTNDSRPSEYLGLLNFTNQGNPHNHVIGIEFDVVNNEEFADINDNHVGIDINSLTSLTSHDAGYWSGEDDDKFEHLKLISGETYQVWIEFLDSQLNVTMARAGSNKPQRSLISKNANLSGGIIG